MKSTYFRFLFISDLFWRNGCDFQRRLWIIYCNKLRMTIDCRIANRLIAICSDRLAGSSYQNTQIFDKLSLLIVINNTKGDILFMCDWKYRLNNLIDISNYHYSKNKSKTTIKQSWIRIPDQFNFSKRDLLVKLIYNLGSY